MGKACYIGGSDGTAKKVKKIYVGVENFTPRTLPSEYTQIAYIETTGTQYIDTGFMPTSNTKVVIDFQSNNVSCHVFGARTSYQSDAFALYWKTNLNNSVQMNDSIFTGGSYDEASRHIVEMDRSSFIVDGVVNSTYSVDDFTCSYNLYLSSSTNSETSENMQGKIFSCKIYESDVLVRDLVPCISSDGAVGLYDLVNGVFYQNAGTGEFTAGTSAYQSLAKKVKKGYVGVGGVAKLFFSGGELGYYGTAPALTSAKYDLAGASNPSYALFAGGTNGTSAYSTVDAYDSSLVKTSADELKGSLASEKKSCLAGASIGDYALFAGGESGSTWYKTVNAYNSSLTRTSPTSLKNARGSLAGASNTGYALFAGGEGSSTYSTVDAYSKSLVQSNPTTLYGSVHNLAGVSFVNYALFAGGMYGTYYGYVNAFNESLVRSNPTALSKSRSYLAGASVGEYALFAGGLYDGNKQSTVDAYNSSLVRSTPTALSEPRTDTSGGSIGEYALFAGGMNSSVKSVTTIDVYDANLVRSTPVALSTARERFANAKVGDYLLFAGGAYDGSTNCVDTVDAYVA